MMFLSATWLPRLIVFALCVYGGYALMVRILPSREAAPRPSIGQGVEQSKRANFHAQFKDILDADEEAALYRTLYPTVENQSAEDDLADRRLLKGVFHKLLTAGRTPPAP